MARLLELYHHGSSTCAAKVRFALAEKGLEDSGMFGKGRWKEIIRVASTRTNGAQTA